ncbi:aminopeptidase [Escherichia coli]|nr:aminopeptidase [Escherichia coli]EKP2308955.1 aminopeptidase [Escherichia coli]EMA2767965.1 aminopeptidase [Escherichia coli]
MTLLASLRDWLKAQQLDAVLLSSRQNKQPHLGISTGSGYVVISRESAHILVDSRYYVEVEARAQGYQLHLLDATNTLTTIVNQIIADEQLQTLGFEGQQVSWETAHRWQSELNAKLVSATPDVLRQIKTPEEVEKIRLACGIADRGAEHIRRFIQAGMSEREIAAELEWFMRQQGAEKASFDTIVASGWRGALPHGKASDKIVAAGEFVTLDFGALYQGYCSDMTRTLLVNGEGVSAESHLLFNVYQIVLQAQLAAISAIRPGVRCQQVDDAARSYDEVMQAGIRPGDRVTFDTTFQVLPHQRVMGKAFDDRLGCYLLVTLLRELHDAELPAEVWLVASSSEEVGLRGGQTATRAVSPDVAIVLDTACWAKNFDYGAANHRQIGNGPMLVLSDKSLIAPPKLTAWVETVAAEIGVPLQADMFSNGGTDGGAVHLTGTGVPTVVMGPATRHGHCAASIADCRDILQMQQLLSALIQRLTRETVVQLTDFR